MNWLRSSTVCSTSNRITAHLGLPGLGRGFSSRGIFWTPNTFLLAYLPSSTNSLSAPINLIGQAKIHVGYFGTGDRLPTSTTRLHQLLTGTQSPIPPSILALVHLLDTATQTATTKTNGIASKSTRHGSRHWLLTSTSVQTNRIRHRRKAGPQWSQHSRQSACRCPWSSHPVTVFTATGHLLPACAKTTGSRHPLHCVSR